MTRFTPRDHDFEGGEFQGIEKGLCSCFRDSKDCSCYAGHQQGLTLCYCIREDCVCIREVTFRAD